MALSVLRTEGSSRIIIYESAATNTVIEDVLAGPLRLFSVSTNSSTLDDVDLCAYLLLYDATTATIGTTEPDEVLHLEAGESGLNGGYMHHIINPKNTSAGGLSFANGLTFACVGGAGNDSDTSSAPGDTETVEVAFEVEEGA
jgi:hypothetical protein